MIILLQRLRNAVARRQVGKTEIYAEVVGS